MPEVVLQTHGAGYDCILSLTDFSVREGEHVALIGPNGAGKSTLLRVLAGLVSPTEGEIVLEGTLLSTLSRPAVARKIAWLSQTDDVTPEFIVEDYIALGRLPFRGTVQAQQDTAALQTAIQYFRVEPFLKRPIGSLSGGERQRVMLARCLAQTPQILLLDEPTNHLDLAARAELLSLLRDLPLTIVAVLHDLSFVPDFAPRTLLMRDGKIILDGASSEVLLSSELGHAFDLNVHPVQLDDGSTTFVFRPRGA